MPKTEKPTEVMVVNNQAKTVFFPGVKLRPGVNSVPSGIADAMKKNPHIKKLVSISTGGVEIADMPPTTKGLDIPAAEALVEKTNDDGLLHKYQSEDGRPAVAKAISDKRETLKPSEKTEEKKGA